MDTRFILKDAGSSGFLENNEGNAYVKKRESVSSMNRRREKKKMNRLFLTIIGLIVLTFGFAPISQAKTMGQNALTIYDTTKVVGLMVKARDGVDLGRIFDLVMDSHGHVDFAIVAQPGLDEFPGRLVAVPFGALKFSQRKSQQIHVVLKTNKEKFYEAPNWGERNLADRQQAASLDRYFGVRPYWTEDETKSARY